MPAFAQTNASMRSNQIFVCFSALRYAGAGDTKSFVGLKAERISYGIDHTGYYAAHVQRCWPVPGASTPNSSNGFRVTLR